MGFHVRNAFPVMSHQYKMDSTNPTVQIQRARPSKSGAPDFLDPENNLYWPKGVTQKMIWITFRGAECAAAKQSGPCGAEGATAKKSGPCGAEGAAAENQLKQSISN